MWIYLGVAVGVVAPALLGMIEYRIERKLDIVLCPREWILNCEWPNRGQRYSLGAKLVDFVPRMQQYTKTAEIMITLSSATIIFIPAHVSGNRCSRFPSRCSGSPCFGEYYLYLGCPIATSKHFIVLRTSVLGVPQQCLR